VSLHRHAEKCRWGIYVILDRYLAKKSHLEIAREVIAGGARVIQLRDKHASRSELVEIGRELRQLTRAAGVTFIVNDYPEVAVEVDADGVHLGQEDRAVHEARQLVGRDKIVGLSTHTLDQALAAMELPVDYIGVGPVYATSTKENPWPVVGVELVRKVKKRVALPIVAIGGITEQCIPELVAAGADNVAMIGELMRAEHLREKMESLVQTFESAQALFKQQSGTR